MKVYVVIEDGVLQGCFAEKNADVIIELVDHDDRKVADEEEANEIQSLANEIDVGLQNGEIKQIF